MQKFKIGYWGKKNSFYRCTQPLIELGRRGHTIINLPDIMDSMAIDYDVNINKTMGILQDLDYLFLGGMTQIIPLSMLYLRLTSP